MVIDAWHIQRAHTPVTDLTSVPVHRIIGVELNDADRRVVGTLFEDTVHRRRYCGEGSFDLPGIITALRAAGWTGPWGVEILSEEHRSLPVRDALDRAADSARRQLELAHRPAEATVPMRGPRLRVGAVPNQGRVMLGRGGGPMGMRIVVGR